MLKKKIISNSWLGGLQIIFEKNYWGSVQIKYWFKISSSTLLLITFKKKQKLWETGIFPTDLFWSPSNGSMCDKRFWVLFYHTFHIRLWWSVHSYSTAMDKKKNTKSIIQEKWFCTVPPLSKWLSLYLEKNYFFTILFFLTSKGTCRKVSNRTKFILFGPH